MQGSIDVSATKSTWEKKGTKKNLSTRKAKDSNELQEEKEKKKKTKVKTEIEDEPDVDEPPPSYDQHFCNKCGQQVKSDGIEALGKRW